MGKEAKRIRLTEDIEGYMMVFKVGDEFETNYPDQGFDDNGSFVICQGMGIYITVEKDKFKIIE